MSVISKDVTNYIMPINKTNPNMKPTTAQTILITNAWTPLGWFCPIATNEQTSAGNPQNKGEMNKAQTERIYDAVINPSFGGFCCWTYTT